MQRRCRGGRFDCERGNRVRYVLRLDEIATDHLALVGGKAAALGEMMRAGFPVPPGFCVTTPAFESCCRWEPPDGRLEVTGITPDVADEVTEAYRSLGEPPVAVRSSATTEDTQESSFAGQYESVLQVVGVEALLRAIRRCWTSLASPRAAAYRERAAPGGTAPAMAVVVQVMIPGRASGVMFTLDPVDGDPGAIVITANPGLASLVVSGRATPDTYRVDRATLRILERDIAEKTEMEVAEDALTRVVPIPERQRRASTLTRRQLAELGRLGVAIEDHFGAPQDIEFVHDGERSWVVQSRPVTGVVTWGTPGKGILLTRHSFLEFLPRPVSPLFETTYLPLMEEFMRRLVAESFGLVERRGRQPAPAFVALNGYAFARIDTRSFLRDYRVSILRLAASPVAFARYVSNLWRHRWRRTVLQPYAHTVARWQELTPETCTSARLWEGVIEICRANTEYWRAALQNRVSGMIEALFLRVYPLLVPGRVRMPVAVFLRGHDSEASRAERELHELFEDVRGDAGLRQVFVETAAGDLETRLQGTPGGRAWLSRVRDYIGHNGHQTSNLDFLEPTLGEVPGALLATVGCLVTTGNQAAFPRFEQGRRERLAAEARLLASLGPLRRTAFSWMQRLLGYGLVLREDVLFYLGLGWPVVRRFILELGGRLAREGFLDAASDVFFLTQAELMALTGGPAGDTDAARTERPMDSTRVKSEVRSRRERWQRQLRLKPPALVPRSFRLLGLFRMSRFMPEYRWAESGGGRLRGVPVSPGRATAPASVVCSMEEFGAMKAETILVAPMTTPAWTPLLAVATGVVTDVGSLLSHASIVAREYGIPAVIGTGAATRRISTGRVVTVDGDGGYVTLHESGQES